MSRFTVERKDGEETLEKMASGLGEHSEALRRHAPTSLEEADDAYKEFRETSLPIFEQQTRQAGHKLYQSIVDHVSGSDSLSEHGDAHVNQKIGDHKETLEEALLEQLKQYHLAHNTPIEKALSHFSDEDDKLAWLASSYDELTGVQDPSKQGGMQALLSLVREGDDMTIGDFYRSLNEEATKKSVERSRQVLNSQAFNRFLGGFGSKEFLDYFLHNLPENHEVEDMNVLSKLRPDELYQALETTRKPSDDNKKELSQYGLRIAD